MALLTIHQITHGFGGPPVLEEATLQVEPGDRVCLIGRNGEGKSTLMKIIEGRITPDAGRIMLQKGAAMGSLSQMVESADADATVRDVLHASLGDAANAIERYHTAVKRLETDTSEEAIEVLTKAQDALERVGGWELEQRLEEVASKLELPLGRPMSELSGGWKRRVALGAALVGSPDVLLLDEPTNHLDVDAIRWMESLLTNSITGLGKKAIIFVTHDRAFLRKVATRIVELDRGELVEFSPDFDKYLEEKEHRLDVEDTHNAEFDKKLAKEEAWIRQGIKARRTRNEGRVRALKNLRKVRSQRRKRKGSVEISVQVAAERTGELVIEAKNIGFRWPDTEAFLLKDISVKLHRAERIALIGPNGVGKTTLLRILLEQLEPTEGVVRAGTNLVVGYHDQLHADLDLSKSVGDTIADENDMVEIDGKRQHVIGYLRQFLFDDDQFRTPVSALSGGERNRLLIARLFSRPTNVLVLDEPTNDLDVETLNVLEEHLLAYPGTVLIVSHDREFVDNVATSSWVFDGNGGIERILGGYASLDELRAKAEVSERSEPSSSPPIKAARTEDKSSKSMSSASGSSTSTSSKPKVRPLGRKERQRHEELTGLIEVFEQRIEELGAKMGDPELYKDPDAVAEVQAALTETEQNLEGTFEEWAALEERLAAE